MNRSQLKRHVSALKHERDQVHAAGDADRVKLIDEQIKLHTSGAASKAQTRGGSRPQA